MSNQKFGTVPDYTYIDRQHQLDLIVTQLENSPRVAVDTESSGYYTYFQELCLIQISANGRHHLIDTIVGLDLSRLGQIFADPDIEIILHAALSDIIELKRGINCDVQNVFDTQLACRYISGDSCSLASLVEKQFDIKLEKKEQKSNWKARPLTRSQLDYAHRDTLYLEQIRDACTNQLKELGLLEEFQIECEYMVQNSEVQEREYNSDSFLRINGILESAPDVRGRAKALGIVRDKIARDMNLAAFRVFSNQSLLQIARQNPKNADDLARIGKMNPRILKKENGRILHALAQATPISDKELPDPQGLQPAELKRLKKLKRARQQIAEYRGIKPPLILANRALEEIALKQPATLDELQKLNVMNPWKLQMYGPQLLLALRGEKPGSLPARLPILPFEQRHAL